MLHCRVETRLIEVGDVLNNSIQGDIHIVQCNDLGQSKASGAALLNRSHDVVLKLLLVTGAQKRVVQGVAHLSGALKVVSLDGVNSIGGAQLKSVDLGQSFLVEIIGCVVKHHTSESVDIETSASSGGGEADRSLSRGLGQLKESLNLLQVNRSDPITIKSIKFIKINKIKLQTIKYKSLLPAEVVTLEDRVVGSLGGSGGESAHHLDIGG